MNTQKFDAKTIALANSLSKYLKTFLVKPKNWYFNDIFCDGVSAHQPVEKYDPIFIKECKQAGLVSVEYIHYGSVSCGRNLWCVKTTDFFQEVMTDQDIVAFLGKMPMDEYLSFVGEQNTLLIDFVRSLNLIFEYEPSTHYWLISQVTTPEMCKKFILANASVFNRYHTDYVYDESIVDAFLKAMELLDQKLSGHYL